MADEFTTGELNPVDLHIADFTGLNFFFAGAQGSVVLADITQVVSEGNPRAFALSLVDVNRVSGANSGFTSLGERVAPGNSWWWLRTPSPDFLYGFPNEIMVSRAWTVANSGEMYVKDPEHSASDGGIRPALIIHQ
ncbi:hypothetical protein [Lactococcus petauri]|uniref:hypothetical protein n=1 Tax=Lactococcus petauri TaxID=1940789 RepID=UPI0022E50524|nr:hypothetical protein [Lactococcus petauri]